MSQVAGYGFSTAARKVPDIEPLLLFFAVLGYEFLNMVAVFFLFYVFLEMLVSNPDRRLASWQGCGSASL
jgi:hypothetical protein